MASKSRTRLQPRRQPRRRQKAGAPVSQEPDVAPADEARAMITDGLVALVETRDPATRRDAARAIAEAITTLALACASNLLEAREASS